MRVRCEDYTLSYMPARLLHFKAHYTERVVHTVLVYVLVGDWAYVLNFGCLERDYEADWRSVQRLLESVRIHTGD